ncbi:hypothetical protein [Phytomonospora endophytica]|uniref:Uncharacterized protein n=1 Tax=Phytomonospora endophytica TaxID=714109 RepID=A0A841FW01_9ACTN|nr:hypothetical protein [Phytomonospora endophytica]MBB6037712.1 hypothetical protein [Phytomonospora endophytica]
MGVEHGSDEMPLLVHGELLCRRHGQTHCHRLMLPPMLPIHSSGFGWRYQCSAPRCDHTRPAPVTDHTVWRLVVETGLADDAPGLTIADKRRALADVISFWVGAA